MSFNTSSPNGENIEHDFSAELAYEHVLDEIIVKFHDRSKFPGMEEQYDNAIKKVLNAGFNLITENVYVVKVEEMAKNPNAVLNRLNKSAYVEYVEPNYIMKLCGYTPNDPLYNTQEAVLTAINAQAGWAITKGEGSPKVAIVDSGVSATHPDLPQVVGSYSAVAGLSPSNDAYGHGTKVAGVVGAKGDNGTGIAGINWNAKLMTVKVDDANKALSTANVVKGIIWAADNGARIINLSLGMANESMTMKDAIDHAYSKNCVIVAASGNDGKNTVNYPARYSKVLAVGASGSGTARWHASNYGSDLDVVGMASYHTTTASNGYVTDAGTSIACPQVTGLASLILAIDSSLTNERVYELIRSGAKPLSGGRNEQTGYGLIDIGNTLAQISDVHPPPPPLPPTPEILLSISNAEYRNKDVAKTHSFQVNRIGSLKISFTGGKNDNYKLSLTQSSVTVANSTSSKGLLTLTYNATITGHYVITIEKISSGNVSYSLTVTLV